MEKQRERSRVGRKVRCGGLVGSCTMCKVEMSSRQLDIELRIWRVVE